MVLSSGEGELVYYNPQKYQMIPLGVVVRRARGVTKWAKWSWRVTAVFAGAGAASGQQLRSAESFDEFHLATVPLELHGAETEAYLTGLSSRVPSIYVVMRDAEHGEMPYEVLLATASPYQAQDYADSGEELVEKVLMPEGVVAWVRDFVEKHHEEEEFVKRRRDKKRIDAKVDGIGDVRISQTADVYRAPGQIKKERLS